MTDKLIADFLDSLAEIIRGDGTWREKREEILAQATESDKSNLEEFASWFEGE